LNRPREGLGAGCAAYGIAFLEIMGLLHPVWKKAWPIRVRVPMAAIGGPITGKKVPFYKVFGMSRWAKENEPHRRLVLYEPTLVWEWIRKTWREESATPTGNVKPDKRGKALGLVYDCRHVPVPDEPIFFGRANQ
jgi:hypothetical protein